MEGSTGNVPNKSANLGRMMDFWQYTVHLWPTLIPAACLIKFSNFMPIIDTSIVTIPTFIISEEITNYNSISMANFVWLVLSYLDVQ